MGAAGGRFGDVGGLGNTINEFSLVHIKPLVIREDGSAIAEKSVYELVLSRATPVLYQHPQTPATEPAERPGAVSAPFFPRSGTPPMAKGDPRSVTLTGRARHSTASGWRRQRRGASGGSRAQRTPHRPRSDPARSHAGRPRPAHARQAGQCALIGSSPLLSLPGLSEADSLDSSMSATSAG